MASTVLFEALEAAGSEVPRSLSEVLDVLRGPLYEALARRLDPTRAAILVEQIEEELTPRPDEPSTVQVPVDLLIPSTERDDATTPVVRLHGPVPVSILARGDGFARRLVIALGEDRVDVHAHADPERWHSASPPQIVILDASDFPVEVTPAAIARWAGTLPPSTALVLWAPDLPYAKNFRREIESAPHEWVTIDPNEGIAPVLDLIRSRRRSMT